MAWLKPRIPSLTEEEARFALAAGLKGGSADGYRVGVFLQTNFKWPVDMALCLLLRDTCDALAFALRVVTREWAVRTGLRFPGRDGHKIEWEDDTGKALSGTIISVDPTFAAAIVQPFDGLIRAGAPRRVFAETVYGNITLGEYAAFSTEQAG